ncbi:MAG: transglycosylase SLT domain-containing protein [Chloroflexia bacterium]|nr:transglycosylase SLT domain-containing protein [Chloroflexia bacterium]
MTSNVIDAALRALATAKSRRAIPGLVSGMAIAAFPSANSAAKKKKKRKKKGKSNGSGCTAQHSEQQILGFIAKAAKRYGQSTNDMERVARCESALDPCAVNRSGPYYGLFQFLKSTWNTTPYGNQNIFDPEAQALATAWMWSEGRKNEWACK